MRRGLLAVAAAALLVFGGFVAAVGGAVRLLGGDRGTLAAEGRVSTPARVLVIPGRAIGGGGGDGRRVSVTLRDGTAGDVRLLLAPQVALRAWLRGVDHASVRDVRTDPLRLEVERRPGGPPRPAPTTFAAAERDRDGHLNLDWREKEKRAAVLVRRSGAPGITAEVRFTADAPGLARVALALLVAGGVLTLLGLLGGVAALVAGRIARVRPLPDAGGDP